jgi:hypothetical protein
MAVLIHVAAFAACFWVLIAVHECGHFLAGWACGISARDMRVRVFTFPQCVELRSEDRWLNPVRNAEAYHAEMWRRLCTFPRMYLDVCGGPVTETLFAAAATAAFLQTDHPALAFFVSFTMVLHYGTYLLFDTLTALRRRRVFGDFSALWMLAKLPTAVLVPALLAIQIFMFWLVKR